eukprot:4927414-Prymnesium_polylepis.1
MYQQAYMQQLFLRQQYARQQYAQQLMYMGQLPPAVQYPLSDQVSPDAAADYPPDYRYRV